MAIQGLGKSGQESISYVGVGMVRRRLLWCALSGFLFVAVIVVTGCVEFSHFGQVSDREQSWSVSGVTIEQRQDDGSWKVLGKTDGKGRYNIFKSTITGGGKIRLRKRGYAPLIMHESQFLQEHSILMYSEGPSGSNLGTGGSWVDPFE